MGRNDDDKKRDEQWDLDEDPFSKRASDEFQEDDSDAFSSGAMGSWKEDDNAFSAQTPSIEVEEPRHKRPLPGAPQAGGPAPSNKPPKRMSSLEVQKQYGVLPTCGVLFVGEAINGGLLGGAIGLFSGISEAYQNQMIGQPDFKYFLRSRVIGNAVSIGGSLAIWRGGTCMAQGIRGKRDIYNSMCGGFCAGMCFALPSRNPRQIVVSGLTYAAIGAVFDTFTGHY